MVDIVRECFDPGVRFPADFPQDMVAIAVGPMQRFVVVASPALIEKTGYPLSPQELAEFPCIQRRFSDGSLYRWQFQRGEMACAIEVKGVLAVDDQQLALCAAVNGIGWAYLYEGIAAPDIAANRLCEALTDWRPFEPGFQLYYPSRRQVSPALRALIDWLKLNT